VYAGDRERVAHQGSMSMTCEAAVRLSATPPALRLMRKTLTSGSCVNFSIMRSLCSMLMLPCRRTHFTPVCTAHRPGSTIQTNYMFNQSNKLHVQLITQTTCFVFRSHQGSQQTMTGNSAHTEHSVCKGMQIYAAPTSACRCVVQLLRLQTCAVPAAV